VPTVDQYGTALGDIARCTACGHAQLDRPPEDAMLAQAYADAESDALADEEAGQRATARGLLARLERERPPGALLDAGCWLGFLLAEARDRGWDPVVGVEPSRFAAQTARARLGLDVRDGDLRGADLPAGAFDAVVLTDVLEHLTDPAAALDHIAKLLVPGGALLLTLPDAGSRVARLLGRRWWSILPTHVQYFSRASARTLLERCGYEVRAVATAPKAFTVRYYLGRTGGYSPALAGALVRAATWARLADRRWAPDFRDRMVVIAVARPRRGHGDDAGPPGSA
jgi:SAM-dependent methyltransferase